MHHDINTHANKILNYYCEERRMRVKAEFLPSGVGGGTGAVTGGVGVVGFLVGVVGLGGVLGIGGIVPVTIHRMNYNANQLISS